MQPTHSRFRSSCHLLVGKSVKRGLILLFYELLKMVEYKIDLYTFRQIYKGVFTKENNFKFMHHNPLH